MLSKKAKYGLKATFFLAKNYGKGPVLISDLAESENIPKKFLELILLDLKRHGILSSKMGKGGGYSLSKPPDKIFVGQIIRILDGPLAPIPCVSKTAYERCVECENEKSCEIRKIMMQVRDASAAILDHTTLIDAPKALFQVNKKSK